MRTKAVISVRQSGHLWSEWPHGTQLMKCPQGIHASRFSSVKHNKQGFEGDGVVVAPCWSHSSSSSICMGSFDVTDADDSGTVISTASFLSREALPTPFFSSLFLEFSMAILGTMIFSFFPSIVTICFCRRMQAMYKSQSLMKSSPERIVKEINVPSSVAIVNMSPLTHPSRRSWSSQHRLIIESLNEWSSSLCETLRSSRAATNRDKVLSSGMFSAPFLWSDGFDCVVRSSPSHWSCSRSKRYQSCFST